MMKRMLAGTALVLGLLQTASAQNQYSNWLYSGSIYILTTPAGANLPASASETNFPVLVRLNAGLFNFSQAKSDGSDIRFATPGGTPLAYEIEQWTTTNASIWVLIPNIKGNTNQQMMMYWGNAAATNASSGRAVFSSTNGYCCVMHMNGNVLDATGSISPVNNGATATTAVIGSTAWDLATGGISAANITNFPTGNNPTSTSEVWLRARSVNQWSQIVGWGNQNAYGWNTWIMQVGFWQSMGGAPYLPSPLTCYGPGKVSGVTPIVAQQWYHVVYTSASGTGAIYVNGVLDATATGGSETITNTEAMNIQAVGGGGGDADADEVRISKVARSANWIRLEYQNQNPLQTLVGCLVPAGTNFSVSPASVTMNENTTTNFTGQAGGAQGIHWVLKQNGQETVVAVDQLNYTYSIGRISGTLSNVLEFVAVYPNGTVQTNYIPVTVLDTIPDPIFTLSPSTNFWDGRSVFTVTPVISNMAALQGAGAANLNYQWTVDGVAVTGQSLPPDINNPGVFTSNILTLVRSQGNGPMTVTLVLDNGGTLVTNSCTITVQQPASDAWVGRTPGPNEVPVNNQFYARDDTGYGTIYYNGTIGGSPNSVFLNVYSNGVLYTNLSQVPSGGKYAFAARIKGGLVTYSVQFGSVTGATTNIVTSVTNLVCGDAYILEGQSNTQTPIGSELSYGPTIYTNYWIRSYGQLGGGTSGGWGYATRQDAQPEIGYWGMDLASNLWAAYNMPICIINGAVGGTMIVQHQANPSNHSAATARGDTIYANLLSRVVAAGLTNGIRGVLWHQGEQDQGVQQGLGYLDYLVYQKYFVNLTAAWKQDYPNIKNYYIFQIWPWACGDDSANDMLREVQRTLPRLYSNLRIMSTLGIVPGSSCHYVPAGYQRFSDLMSPLVQQDNYGYAPAGDITAPDLKQAYYTTTNKNEIALVFGQNMTWGSTAVNRFFMDYVSTANTGASGKVVSGSASGNVVRLELSGASNYQTITYLVGGAWDGVQTNLLYGGNGIAALTFCAVPILASAPVSGTIANLPASGVSSNAAVLNATVGCSGTNLSVSAYWGTVNGGTNAAAWSNSAYVGTWTNVASTNLSLSVSGLSPLTSYYFTFRGTNAAGSLWAPNTLSFTTLPPPGPAVDNAGGATNLFPGVAQLCGTLAIGPADVRLYWGPTDGGTNPANWSSAILLPGVSSGVISSNISNLLYGVTYYYRSYASNRWGTAWALATTNFTTLRPASSLANSAATAVTTGSAALNATLACAGAVYNVVAYWNTVNGGTNATLWANSAYVGACTNLAATNLTYTPTGLSPATPWFFTFCATNALDTLWATNVLSFTTLTPPPPVVDNAAGAANQSPGLVQLRGTLNNGPADVRLYWGAADGGTNGPWANTNLVAGAPNGSFSSSAGNLVFGLTYYYRAYASNRWGAAWAPATASFTTLKPLGAPAGQIPYDSIIQVAASSEITGYEAVNAFNGNGLLGDGTQGTFGEWASSGAQPVGDQWLKVEFDQSYPLDYLRVWAFNEGEALCVTNADVYVINSGIDPGNNVHLGGGPFSPTGWTLLLAQQAFTPSPGGSPETNTDPHISLSGVTARQLALKINATWQDLGLAGFGEVQIYRLAPTPINLTNTPATEVAATSAMLNGTLACAGAVYDVYACWNTVNGGTNATLWTNSVYVGSWTNVSSANLGFTATGLTPNTPYYFTFRATNPLDSLWATNVQSFTTLASLGPPPPVLPGGAITVVGGVPSFTFPTVAGHKYRLVCKSALTDSSWLPVIAPPDFPLPDAWSATSTGSPMSLTDTNAAGQTQRFYRLELANP